MFFLSSTLIKKTINYITLVDLIYKGIQLYQLRKLQINHSNFVKSYKQCQTSTYHDIFIV